MQILENYDLTSLNTFGVPAEAKFFAEVGSEEELTELASTPEFKENRKMFLGGGSNILLTQDFDGIVVLNKLKGIAIIDEDDSSVVVRSMSGESWHDLVLFAVDRGYWGIENLAFVPGTVGAAPMQNIGAYGGELKHTLVNVEAYSIIDGEKKIFTKEECKLGYRDSIFKNIAKDKYFILAVTLRLSKIPQPNLKYKTLKEFLEKNQIEVKTPLDVSEAVTSIRKSKLPDPKVIGNAGSFFKNVFVDAGKLKDLLKEYPQMPHFIEDGIIKIPSGWLIEQCGWKGKRVGSVGVHDKQALVLVNHGGAKGEEIKALSEQIMTEVFDKFGLKLVPEVNLI